MSEILFLIGLIIIGLLSARGRNFYSGIPWAFDYVLTETKAGNFKFHKWHWHVLVGLPVGFFTHWFLDYGHGEPWYFRLFVIALYSIGGAVAWEVGQSIISNEGQNKVSTQRTNGDIAVSFVALLIGGVTALICGL